MMTREVLTASSLAIFSPFDDWDAMLLLSTEQQSKLFSRLQQVTATSRSSRS
jgi:hypothetical protein